MDKFVKRYATSEEAIPSIWKTDPLPKGPTKRPVGRPTKRKMVDDIENQPSPKRPCQDRLLIGDNEVTPSKRGAYKVHDVKKKKEVATFKASRHWADRFMVRHDLVLRAKTSMSQKLPEDLESKIAAFHDFIRKQRIEDEFEDRLIINMDETPMYFDMVPARTIDTVGSKSVRVKTTASDIRHLTVVLACTANGDMLPPMIIFKGKRELDIPVPNGWVVTVQEKGWVDETIMLRWVKEILVRFSDKDRALLVMDSFRAHITDSVKRLLRKCNVVPAVIPGGCTSKIQPLDVSINKPFKAEIRKGWTSFMRTAVRQSIDSKEKVKAATKAQVVEWIQQAFDHIAANRTLIMKSFLVCGISNSLSGDEDSCIRNDSVIMDASASNNLCSLFLDSDDDDEEFEGFDPVDILD